LYPTKWVRSVRLLETTSMGALSHPGAHYSEGGGSVPDDARVPRIRDVYIYKHPDGWWLRVQASFHPGMEGVPDLLASRRDTLRQVVNSVRIEPKDASRVSCTTDDKGLESCLYHRPQAQ